MENGVSEILSDVIRELMDEPLLSDFHLGGGTNLAIKYNHRESIDIDLFSSGVVGLEKMKKILERLQEKYANDNIEAGLENSTIDHLSFIKAFITRDGIDIKIEIIQNIKILYPITNLNGIRLIDDLDIGSLKLLAAADRGQQKDFYDLYLLSEKYGLDTLYDVLRIRHDQFDPREDENIFNRPDVKPKEDLRGDLTALGNFNNAKDKSKSGNQVKFTKGTEVNMPLPDLKRKWIKMVQELAKAKDLKFKETKRPRRSGLFLKL